MTIKSIKSILKITSIIVDKHFSLDIEALNNLSEDKVYVAKRMTSNENDIGNLKLQPLITNLILPNENNKNSPKM